MPTHTPPNAHTLDFTSTLTPCELVASIATNKPDWCVFWLHNDGSPIIGILPKISWTLYNTAPHNTLTLSTQTHTTTTKPTTLSDFKQVVQNYFNQHQVASLGYSPTKTAYHHGLLGFVNYDITAQALDKSVQLGTGVQAFFAHYPSFIRYNEDMPNIFTLCSYEAIDLHKIAQTLHRLPQPPKPTPITLTPNWTPNHYHQVFAQTQAHLHAGDAYQINLTQNYTATYHAPLVCHLPSLFQATKAPFSGFVQIDNEAILSVSPELFFHFGKEGRKLTLTTKPIKGTRPRSTNPDTDKQLKNELTNSEKDLAENVMIVDLLRNDLGRFAKKGGVRVPIRFAIESFSNVHHMVSTIQADITDQSALAALWDSLPAGSITGSPKKHACKLIHTLENRTRGAYCGTMGFLNFDETGQFNVLIRTLHQIDTTIHAGAGGGVTVLSDRQSEYQECHDKIGQIRHILQNP